MSTAPGAPVFTTLGCRLNESEIEELAWRFTAHGHNVVDDPASAVNDLPARGPVLRAWPNPFNPQTLIAINLPEPGPVTVDVFDVMGRSTLQLEAGIQPAGEHTFTVNAANRPSGVTTTSSRSGR